MAYNDGLANVTTTIGHTYVIKNDGLAIVRRNYRDKMGISISPLNSFIAKNSNSKYVNESLVPVVHSENSKKIYDANTYLPIVNTFATMELPIILNKFCCDNVIAYDVNTNSLEKSFCKLIKTINGDISITRVARDNENKWNFNNVFYSDSTTIVEQEEGFIITSPATTLVESVNKTGFLLSTQALPATALVEDYKPPSFNNNGSGSGLKIITLTLQVNAFVEMYMVFDDCKVTDAIGLPYGLSIDKSYVKGTPLLAGTYPVKFLLDNGRILDSIITIPQLPRKL